MYTRLLISIGAGLAAAVFFIVPMKGAMAAGLTMLFAPLPLMIAGLSFAPSSAIAGAVAGGLLVWGIVNEYYAVFFLAWAGIPAFWLTRLAWLARPAAEGEPAGADGLVWYPTGDLAFWAAILGAAVAAGMVLTGSLYFGSFDAFHAQMTRALTPALEGAMKTPSAPKLPEGATIADIASYVAYAMPAVLAAWAMFSYAGNLWLAGRVAMISQRMKRAWLDVPETFRLPRLALPVLAFAVGTAAIAPGLTRSLGIIVMAALIMAFSLQGYAVLHHHARNLQARTALLSALYLATFFFFPAPLIMAAVFGIAHGLVSTRPTRPQDPNQPN